MYNNLSSEVPVVPLAMLFPVSLPSHRRHYTEGGVPAEVLAPYHRQWLEHAVRGPGGRLCDTVSCGDGRVNFQSKIILKTWETLLSLPPFEQWSVAAPSLFSQLSRSSHGWSLLKSNPWPWNLLPLSTEVLLLEFEYLGLQLSGWSPQKWHLTEKSSQNRSV